MAEQDMEPSGADSIASGAWSRVDTANEVPGAIDSAPAALGAEPRLGAGVAGALQLALSKGYLERPGAAPAPRSQHLHLLQARHYSIEDKTYAGWVPSRVLADSCLCDKQGTPILLLH